MAEHPRELGAVGTGRGASGPLGRRKAKLMETVPKWPRVSVGTVTHCERLARAWPLVDPQVERRGGAPQTQGAVSRSPHLALPQARVRERG